jgi:hypothetical protein
MECSFCGEPDIPEVLDLHHQPFSNGLLTKDDLLRPEVYYPLKLHLCPKCGLVQLSRENYGTPELFPSAYPYFSSQSPTNVSHAKEYVDMITKRLRLKRTTFSTEGSVVIEIGGNDGYLLQHFKKGIKTINIEPVAPIAEISLKKGIHTVIDTWENCFLKAPYTTRPIPQADLICGINVLAHMPDIHRTLRGLTTQLAPRGTITFEFPKLSSLVKNLEFDTIYHEHFYYFSLHAIIKIFKEYGLDIYDIDNLPEHGGSLRIYACHENVFPISEDVERELDYETKFNAEKQLLDGTFRDKIENVRRNILDFLHDKKAFGFKIYAYGAAAKASVFFNYCGIGPDLITAVVDRSPHKQGKYMPGSHIPIVDEKQLKKEEPDYVLITAWNLKEEIMKQLGYIKKWDSIFVTAIPKIEVF